MERFQISGKDIWADGKIPKYPKKIFWADEKIPKISWKEFEVDGNKFQRYPERF